MIKPKKPSTRLLAFASDSDSDDEPSKKRVATDASSTQKRQARIIQEDALKEDPTIFQYDEVYDDMTTTREEAKKAKSNEVRESKYISRLLVTAEKRKLEHETRLERKIQKEREAEGDKFKDKEVFVTASYRAKLEAMKKAEEEAKREEYLESIGDVRKQKDLSGFYRHMYEQKVGSDKPEAKLEGETKPEEGEEKEAPVTIIKKDEKPASKRRAYRKHEEHESDDEEEASTVKKGNDESKKVHLQSNLDADSDFSIDSDSDASDKEEKPKIDEKQETENGKSETEKVEESVEVKPVVKEEKEENGEAVKTEDDTEKMPPPAPKPKIDVWKKRTVGDAYLAAVQRYYQRKQQGAA